MRNCSSAISEPRAVETLKFDLLNFDETINETIIINEGINEGVNEGVNLEPDTKYEIIFDDNETKEVFFHNESTKIITKIVNVLTSITSSFPETLKS